MKAKEDKGAKPWGCILMAIILMSCTGLLAMLACASIETKNLRVEAVKRGFAEYKVDSEGNIEWKWKNAEK